LWNIVESKEWANLVPEMGQGGDTSKSQKYLNAKENGSFGAHLKNKKYEEVYGEEKAKELKLKISESNNKRQKKPETGLKISETRKRLFNDGSLKCANQYSDPIKCEHLKKLHLEKIKIYRNQFLKSNLSRKQFANLHNVNHTTMKKYLKGL